MTTKRFLISILLVALVSLTACDPVTISFPGGSGINVNGSPVPAMEIQIGFPDSTATVNPLSPATFTPTPIGTLQSALPTDADSCPVAIPVAPGNAFNRYTFEQGKTYHLNLSLEGAPANVEGNLLFVPTQTFTVEFDGSAWNYAGSITDSKCQFCEETAGDYVLTLDNVPQLKGLIEVLDTPCTTGIGTTTLKVHKLEVITSAPITPTVTNTPVIVPTDTPASQASSFCPGVVAQGVNQTLTLVPGVVYGFSWYFFGDSHEYVTLITVDQDVTASAVNGTVSCWLNTPSRHDTGVENANHMSATLATMMEHISLSPSSSVQEVPFPQ